jgi:hypothetical protein
LQWRQLRRARGGFIRFQIRRNQYRKPQEPDGRKSTGKKTQTAEEGRRDFSESFEEKPSEEDPLPDRRF